MICDKCKQKLIVQQTIRYINGEVDTILRRRFCPMCRIVYMTEEKVVNKYELQDETGNDTLSTDTRKGVTGR